MYKPAPSITAVYAEPKNRNDYLQIRPRLVLKVSARSISMPQTILPQSNQSESWNDHVHNERPIDTEDDEDTSDEDDGADHSFLLRRRKRAARRSRWQKNKKCKTYSMTSALIPEPQPANRARIPERGLGQRVGFAEKIEIYQLPEEEEVDEEEGPTAMERMLQMEKLKQWVLERSSEGLGEMGWVRRLVELEMEEL
jgi:hypothetical protein